MATYAIGDIQGCFWPFQRLLKRIGFRADADRLWLVGDVVNRGPASLSVLRWLVAHRDQVVAVLGNHDIHLLAHAAGVDVQRDGDTLQSILDAPDRDALVAWLADRPLLHREGDRILIHAGLLPRWDAGEAVALAREAEAFLHGPERVAFLTALYRDKRRRWRDDLDPRERALVTIAVMTRLRLVDADGQVSRGYKGPPELAPKAVTPWFRAPGRRTADQTVVFGHWATLGLWIEGRVMALDSGCVWGGTLTAVRLEDGAVFSVPAFPP